VGLYRTFIGHESFVVVLALDHAQRSSSTLPPTFNARLAQQAIFTDGKVGLTVEGLASRDMRPQPQGGDKLGCSMHNASMVMQMQRALHSVRASSAAIARQGMGEWRRSGKAESQNIGADGARAARHTFMTQGPCPSGSFFDCSAADAR
jgi:hypothetical protein